MRAIQCEKVNISFKSLASELVRATSARLNGEKDSFLGWVRIWDRVSGIQYWLKGLDLKSGQKGSKSDVISRDRALARDLVKAGGAW